ncbi:hypothetical protein BN1723_020085, partial [Verticillium longisporum]|jgi:adenylosuccinate synthase
LR